MSNTSNTCIVLGATGLLGKAIYHNGVRRGFKVIGLARKNSDYAVDITDWSQVSTFLDLIKPDVIVNTVAITNLDQCEQSPAEAYNVNARAVAFLANYCEMHEVKLVQVSTDHFFSGDKDALHDEVSRIKLVNEYARTKFAGEAFAATAAHSLILRTNIVGFRGWGDRPTFVEWALRALEGDEPVPLYDDFFTSSIDVNSFSSILYDLLDKDVSGLLNVAARDVLCKKDFVLGLAKRLEFKTSHCYSVGVNRLSKVPRADSLGLDVSRAENILGYKLPSTELVLDSLAEQFEDLHRALP